MGASKKNDRRAANYQARQRQAAADAKAEKERQKREDYWSQAVVPNQQYASGGIVASSQWVTNPGVQFYLGSHNVGGWHVGAWPEAEAPPADLPKSESTEVITAFRMWHLKRTFPTGYRLVPMNENFGEVIPFEKMTAECKAGGGYVSGHVVPDESCTCGFHGYTTSVLLEHHGKPYVAGEVNLWGKVVVHADGYRAQFAYPKRLFLIDGGPRADKIADALSWTYGVPCEPWDG